MLIFRERLKARRERLNMTQVELAEKSGVSFRSISDYERGKGGSPAIDQVGKLAKALNVPVSWLIGEDVHTLHDPERQYAGHSLPLEYFSAARLRELRSDLQSRLSCCDGVEYERLLEILTRITQELQRKETAETSSQETLPGTRGTETAGPKEGVGPRSMTPKEPAPSSPASSRKQPSAPGSSSPTPSLQSRRKRADT